VSKEFRVGRGHGGIRVRRGGNLYRVRRGKLDSKDSWEHREFRGGREIKLCLDFRDHKDHRASRETRDRLDFRGTKVGRET